MMACPLAQVARLPLCWSIQAVMTLFGCDAKQRLAVHCITVVYLAQAKQHCCVLHDLAVPDDAHIVALLQALDMMPSIKNAVGNLFPIFMDGGIRRGTDMLKVHSQSSSASCIATSFRTFVQWTLQRVCIDPGALWLLGVLMMHEPIKPACSAHAPYTLCSHSACACTCSMHW